MAQAAKRSSKTVSEANRPRRRQRLTAEARKHSILAGARRAFAESGDVNGTTVKEIAQRAGISEGMIYRHFESKDQLFIEAVVEPLQETVDGLVRAAQIVGRHNPLTPQRQVQTTTGLYRELVSTFEEVLPLLGLVLFGDPQVARRFYRKDLAGAMDRLAEAWREFEDRYGEKFGSGDIAVRAVMGIALMLALESRYARGFDRDRALALAGEGTIKGFFPTIDPARQRR
jgi:AcrR family transcriptional regulator